MSITKIFKPYIANSTGYKGGKSAVSSDDGSKIYKLSSNENVLGSAFQKKPGAAPLNYNIYPDATSEDLFIALERFYKHELSKDQFIAGNGGSDLLQMIVMAFLDHETNCIISNPCFGPYKMFSGLVGATVKDIPLLSPTFALDVNGIIAAIDKQTRVIFLTSPNNPTGTYLKKQEVTSLLEQVPDHVVVVYDEVYHHFADKTDYSTALPFVKTGYNVIAINSFSKAYGLAGLRIGYGYTTETIAAYLRKLHRPFLINSVSKQAAIIALQNQEFIKYTIDKISEQREALCAGFDALGLKYWPSQANFVLVKSPDKFNNLTQLLHAHNIMVRPTENFGAPGCIRITIGDQDATDATLNALATILG